jgi:hypothetical protein
VEDFSDRWRAHHWGERQRNSEKGMEGTNSQKVLRRWKIYFKEGQGEHRRVRNGWGFPWKGWRTSRAFSRRLWCMIQANFTFSSYCPQALCFGVLGVLFMAISLGFMFANWATGQSRMSGH